VATDEFLLSFENYEAAIEVAQGAACVLRHRGRTDSTTVQRCRPTHRMSRPAYSSIYSDIALRKQA
jgi:hypothetical protein